jgi:hypothetical protein
MKKLLTKRVERWLNAVQSSVSLRRQQQSDRSDNIQAKSVRDPPCGPIIEDESVCLKIQGKRDRLSFPRAQRRGRHKRRDRASKRLHANPCGRVLE